MFWANVCNIYTASDLRDLSVVRSTERSRCSGALRALAESSRTKIYSHISTSSLDTLDSTNETLLSRVTATLHYLNMGHFEIN